MTPEEFRSILQTLGLTQADFAHLVDVTPRAVSLWMVGERSIPGPGAAYARLLVSLPLNLRQAELARLRHRRPNMKNGMYGIWYTGTNGTGEGVLTFEDGIVYGADVGGAKYDGTYTITEQGHAHVLLKVTFPPNGITVFGVSHPFEWSIDISAMLDPAQDRGEMTVTTSLGNPIAARFVYLRSLPRRAA